MNFFQLFFYKILENIPQNAPNCTIFKKISRVSMPPNPPPPHQTRGFAMQIPLLFPKYILNYTEMKS